MPKKKKEHTTSVCRSVYEVTVGLIELDIHTSIYASKRAGVQQDPDNSDDKAWQQVAQHVFLCVLHFVPPSHFSVQRHAKLLAQPLT